MFKTYSPPARGVFWNTCNYPQVPDVGPAGEDDDDDYSAFAEFDDPSPAVDASDSGSEFDWDWFLADDSVGTPEPGRVVPQGIRTVRKIPVS
jgi:hypothetical protein